MTLSAGSHVLLSRVPLPLATVAAVSAAVFVVAYALAGRERGFGPIAGLLVPLELAADTVFTTGQHVCYGPAGGPVAGSAARGRAWTCCAAAAPVGGPLAGVAGPAARPRRHCWPPAGPCAALAAARRPRRRSDCSPPPGCAAASGRWAGCCGAVAAFALPAAAARGRRGRPRPPRPVRRRPRPRAARAPAARTRLLVHSVGRRGPPRSAAPSPAPDAPSPAVPHPYPRTRMRTSHGDHDMSARNSQAQQGGGPRAAARRSASARPRRTRSAGRSSWPASVVAVLGDGRRHRLRRSCRPTSPTTGRRPPRTRSVVTPKNTRARTARRSSSARPTAKKTLELYEDSRCPVCAQLRADGRRDRSRRTSTRASTSSSTSAPPSSTTAVSGEGSKNALSALGAALNVSPEAFLDVQGRAVLGEVPPGGDRRQVRQGRLPAQGRGHGRRAQGQRRSSRRPSRTAPTTPGR